MKAQTYRPCREDKKTTRCDNLLGVTNVTATPERDKNQLNVLIRMSNRCDSRLLGVTTLKLLGVTRHRSGYVTATAVIDGAYVQRLKMSKRKIKAIWLTLERVAELKGCTARTVWRYVKARQLQTYKHLIQAGQRKIYKTFILTDPEILSLELESCRNKGLVPDEVTELVIEIEGKPLNSALIHTYIEDTGGYDGL